LRAKGNTPIAEARQADRIPGYFGIRLNALDQYPALRHPPWTSHIQQTSLRRREQVKLGISAGALE
jgi:hypothetical protein